MAIRMGAVIVALAGALALAGCGDDEETTASTTASEESGGGGSLQVSETEYALDPADTTVPAGPVSIEVTNDGEIPHNLELEGNSVEEELEADLDAGESGTLEVDLEPGTYEWYCPIANHRELGMEGKITVAGGASTSTTPTTDDKGGEDSGGTKGPDDDAEGGGGSGSGGGSSGGKGSSGGGSSGGSGGYGY